MAKSLIQSRRRRRRSDSDVEHRTLALYEAGSRLLSRHDFDHVSMERLAREAGCSVGALYDRFHDKETFLRRLSGMTFRTLRDDANLVLDAGHWRRENTKDIVDQIVRQLVSRITTRRAAGVIRATIKLGATDNITRAFFEDYRKDITENVVELLASRLEYGGAARVRIAMQIVFATVTDAIVHKQPGAMQAGSPRMIDALSKIVCGYLGIAGAEWAGDEADGEDALIEEFETATEPEVPDGHIPLYDPDLKVYRGIVATGEVRKTRASRARKSQAITEQNTVKTVKPAHVPTSSAEPDDKPPTRKRRHKII